MLLLSRACPILNMPAEMSVDLKQCIVDWYLVDQYTYRQIAELASCSIGHVSNVMRNFQEFAQVKNPFSSYTGHPSQVEEGDIGIWSKQAQAWAWGERQVCGRASLGSHCCESSHSVCLALWGMMAKKTHLWTSLYTPIHPWNWSALAAAHLLWSLSQLKMTTGSSGTYNAVPESFPLAGEGTWPVMRGAGLNTRGYWGLDILLGWKVVIIEAIMSSNCHMSHPVKSGSMNILYICQNSTKIY